MEKEKLLTKEDNELIGQYMEYLKRNYNDQLCCALVYFLSKDSDWDISTTNKRKAFLLKVLRECTVSCNLDLNLFPMEIKKKLIVAYTEAKTREEQAKQEHIAELMKEMNEIF